MNRIERQYIDALRAEIKSLATGNAICSDCGFPMMPITGCYCKIAGKETMLAVKAEIGR